MYTWFISSASGIPSVKLMFVGLSGRGKTTLLHHMIHSGKPLGQLFHGYLLLPYWQDALKYLMNT